MCAAVLLLRAGCERWRRTVVHNAIERHSARGRCRAHCRGTAVRAAVDVSFVKESGVGCVMGGVFGSVYSPGATIVGAPFVVVAPWTSLVHLTRPEPTSRPPP